VTSTLDLQRVIGNQSVQRVLDAGREMPGTRSSVTHRYTLPAVIRRALRGNSVRDKETVRFSAVPGIDVPTQYDAIRTTLTYDPSITPVAPPASPGKLGETNTRVDLVVEAVITCWVSGLVYGATRKNVSSDADPNITQANYPTVVSDLTPSPKAVKAGGLDLLKNQPPRTKFWARDLTSDHEFFHADENKKFSRQLAVAARDWLNTQTAKDLGQVEALVGKIPPMISRGLAVQMAPPGVEQRAYDDGAAAYTTRAQAIKAKGDAKGYVPKAPASP
jgi:hypothetical protein